ncbi:hypothetical protein HK096_001501 [Nowakowskiella sp. JEL0078]|nr:hypothetical protein HK096_001501 [Nowakowskiella sp. JEL0078]
MENSTIFKQNFAGSSINFHQVATGGSVQYDQVIPNFVCKHVRTFCDDITKVSRIIKNSSDSKSPMDPMVPVAIEGFAAVVMVDVSGYSKLSATLAELGPVGAEILGKTMKGYLDKIIHIILLHGGDIYKFAGDAVVFYWKMEKTDPMFLDDNRRGELVLKASHCCLDLLTKLGTYDINIQDCDTKVLRIHLGIGAGKIYDVHIGDLGRWEHFVASDAVNQLAHVLDLAKAGELAMSHQALKWFSTVMDIGTVTIGNYDKRCIILSGLEHARRKVPPPTPTDFDDLLLWEIQVGGLNHEYYKRFIAHSALFKLQADLNQSRLFQLESSLTELMSLSELRQVTTMFIRVGSLFNWETADVLVDAQAAMKIVQKALNRFEGSLRQFHVDDKGASILSFFGLPPLAHENDSVYGIKAAIEIMDGFKDLFDEFSIGLTTGVVSIGGVGNAIRTEYAVMGDSINMAARLMFLPDAQNSILCDETSYNLSEREFVFEKLGEAKVKGKIRPIQIFRPKSIVPESSKPNRAKVDGNEIVLLGRAKEKKAIHDALNSLRSKVEIPKIIMTQSEGGQGLSSLVKFTQIESLKYNCFSCMGSAVETERSTPYYVFRDILCELLSLIDEGNVVNNVLTLKGKSVSQTAVISEYPTVSPSKVVIIQNSHPKLKITDRIQIMLPKEHEKIPNPSEGKRFSLTDSSTNKTSILTPQIHLNRAKSKNFLPILKIGDKPPNSNYDDSPITPPLSQIPVIEESYTIVESDTHESLSFNKLRDKFMSVLSGNDAHTSMSTLASELEDRTRQILQKVNEGAQLTSLFNLILPFDFAEAECIAQLQGKVRTKELQELVRRVINYVAETNALVLIFHEAQWMDISSWEFLCDIAHFCPKVMVCVFSRPMKYFESEDTKSYLSKLKRSSRAVVFFMEGLNPAETQELIIHTWQGSSVRSVSPKIVESIYKRTNGNPLFVKSLVVALRESGKWRVSDQGDLQTVDGDFDFEQVVLGNDLQSIIVAQFDRLDRYFQLFLKVASVLGQRFLLEDVMYFLSDMTGFSERFDRKNISSLLKNIEQMDGYGYLQSMESEQEGHFFNFKSAVVRKGIYSMMVKSQRQQLHLNIALYYEKLLNDSNRHRLLVPLYEHFIETDDRQNRKKLTYLEAVAHLYFEKHSMPDAIKHYVLLLNTVELLVMVHGLALLFKKLQIAAWHRELGEAYFSRMDIDNAELHLLQSLTLVGHPFPMSSLKLTFGIRRERSLRSKYSVSGLGDSFKNLKRDQTENIVNNLSVNSAIPLVERMSLVGLENIKNSIGVKSGFALNISSSPVLNTLSKSQNPIFEEGKDELHIVRQILLTLSQLYIMQEKPKHHKYSVMKGLNISEKFQKDSIYAKFLAFAGSAFWTMEMRRSAALRYLDAADRHDRRSDPNASASIVSCQAQTLFLMGDWASSYQRFELLLQLGSITGDFNVLSEALRMRSLLNMHRTSLSVAIVIAKTLYTSSNQEENWEGKFWGLFMTLSSKLASDDSDQIDDVFAQLKYLWNSVSDLELRKMNPSFHICYLAVVAEAESRMLKKLSTPLVFLMSEIEKFLVKVTAQNFMAIVGLLNLSNVLIETIESNLNSYQKTDLRKIFVTCKKIAKILRNIQVCSLSLIVRYLFKGIRFLIKSESKQHSLKQWKKALILMSPEFIFLRGYLNSLIARYSPENSLDRSISGKEALNILQKIGAMHEFKKVKKLLLEKG